MTTVNPVQTTTYYLTAANNPITFGTGTDINVSSGTGIGVYGSNAQSWRATNEGAINGHLYGVDLTAGGSVTNAAGATISGGHAGFYYPYFLQYGGGVRIDGGVGTVTNAGTISSLGLYGGKFAVYLGAGGSVTNEAGATISGYTEIAGGAGTVTNAGNIGGVELQAGGSVTNQAGATINGGFVGVYLTAGGSVTNEAGGMISTDIGVRARGSAATVTNAGTISGSSSYPVSGVGLYAGGSVVNEAGATISAAYGVYINGGTGTVTNAGDISGEGNFRGFNRGVGVDFYAGGSLTNQGTGAISGYNAGVFFLAGGPGTVTNSGVVTNAGAISGHKLGVFALRSAATVTNAGDINGEGGIVAMGSVAIVTNSGSIAGTKAGSTFFFAPITLGDGVLINAGGAVSNKGGGTITGVADGVYVAGGGAVTNAGTISGPTASVEFAGAGANTLTLESGSTLNGDAIGSAASGATNALVLQGTGTANNNFDNFNALNVQASADWTLGGDSTFGAATVSSSALFDITGSMTTTGTVLNKGTIGVSSGALDLEGAVSGKGTDTISGASTLEFDSTVGGGQTVGFTGGGGTLDLLDPLGFAAKISGFAATDSVELSGDWVFSHFSETGNGNMGTLTLANGSNDLSLHFLGDYTASDFNIASGATTIISHT
jgi:hypothetical protein